MQLMDVNCPDNEAHERMLRRIFSIYAALDQLHIHPSNFNFDISNASCTMTLHYVEKLRYIRVSARKPLTTHFQRFLFLHLYTFVLAKYFYIFYLMPNFKERQSDVFLQ